MARRSPAPEVLDQKLLEEAARLLLGDEFKRPLATLLGPHHPHGAREHLDYRLPFRWFASQTDANGEPNKGWRPVPAWVWPVIARLLAERAGELVHEADHARRSADRARALAARLEEIAR